MASSRDKFAGLAATAGVLLFALIFALTLVQRLTIGREERL